MLVEIGEGVETHLIGFISCFVDEFAGLAALVGRVDISCRFEDLSEKRRKLI